MNISRHLGALVIALSVLAWDATGCSHEASASRPAAASQGSEATPPERQQWTDGQILYVLGMVDTGEIAQAQLAENRASSSAVKSFADDMIRAHTDAKQQAERLMAEQGIVASDSHRAHKLGSNADKTLSQLQAASTADFDAEYMKAQVTQHQEVLDMIRQRLIPAADNANVRMHLQQAAQMVATHLEQAHQLQTTTPPT